MAKEQIIENSLKQFLANGIRNMTVQKLAAAMGISTKTVYKFFADKEELLEECLKVHYSGMYKLLKSMQNEHDNPVSFLCSVYEKAVELDFGTNYLFYNDLNYYYPELQDKIIKQLSSNVTYILTGAISLGITGEYFLSHLQPAVLLEALTVLYASATRYDTYKKFNLTPIETSRHTVDIYLRGICAEKGLKIINQMKINSNI